MSRNGASRTSRTSRTSRRSTRRRRRPGARCLPASRAPPRRPRRHRRPWSGPCRALRGGSAAGTRDRVGSTRCRLVESPNDGRTRRTATAIARNRPGGRPGTGATSSTAPGAPARPARRHGVSDVSRDRGGLRRPSFGPGARGATGGPRERAHRRDRALSDGRRETEEIISILKPQGILYLVRDPLGRVYRALSLPLQLELRMRCTVGRT